MRYMKKIILMSQADCNEDPFDQVARLVRRMNASDEISPALLEKIRRLLAAPKPSYTIKTDKVHCPPNWPFSNQLQMDSPGSSIVESTRIAFWNMLVSLMPETGYSPVKGNETIVSIACGTALELLPATAYFGRNPDPFFIPDNVQTCGIDINEESIRRAIFNNTNPDGTFLFKLIVGDARFCHEHEDIPKDVDIVILRHQEFCSDHEIWGSIFMSAYKILRQGGGNAFYELFSAGTCHVKRIY